LVRIILLAEEILNGWLGALGFHSKVNAPCF
jgi:hypothetical protein